MKKILTLFSIMFMSCATTLPSVGPTNEMIDGADKIFLTVDQTPNEAYQNFAQYLSDNGFGFEHTDETLKILKTDFKQGMGKLNYSLGLNVSIRRNEDKTIIQIMGSAKNPVLGDWEIRNRGASGSLVKVSWNEMHELTMSYKHSEIMYSRN